MDEAHHWQKQTFGVLRWGAFSERIAKVFECMPGILRETNFVSYGLYCGACLEVDAVRFLSKHLVFKLVLLYICDAAGAKCSYQHYLHSEY